MNSVQFLKSNKIGFGLVIIFIACVTICCWPKKIVANLLIQRELINEVPIVKQDDFQMTDSLKKWSLEKDIFEIEGMYNKEKIRYYKSQSNSLSIQTKLATQYLLAGYPDSTLLLINDIYKNKGFLELAYISSRYSSKPKLKSTMFSSYIFDQNWGNENFQRGLCYMRMAEIKNCQNFGQASSCIFPFKKEAIHKNVVYGEKAISYFENHLKEEPKDHVAQWLLNIAYLFIGKDAQRKESSFYINMSVLDDPRSLIGTFNNVAASAGLNSLTLYGSGVIEDFNEDGYMDIFTSSGDLDTEVELYLNLGDGNFQNITEQANLSGQTGGVNAVQVDFDNDGLIDIYLIRGGWLNLEGQKHPNSLLKNMGNGKFYDVTEEMGLLSKWSTHTASWADLNLDGYLDLFVGNERGKSHLFINQKGKGFIEQSTEVGIILNEYVKGAVWLDFDNDNDQDLYVSTYVGSNHLYQNYYMESAGKLYFEEITEQAGVQEPFYSFPVASFDFNNDGFSDILCADFTLNLKQYVQVYIDQVPSEVYPALYINNGDGTFSNKWADVAFKRQTLAMGMNIADVNNDGWEDIYLATGYPDVAALVPNLLYLNLEGSSLANVSAQSGMGHLQKGHEVAFGDINNDGFQDAYISLGGWYSGDAFDNVLFENPKNQNNWVIIELEGEAANKSAIGAKLKLQVSLNGKEKKEIYRVVGSNGSYGASSLQLEIGIGKANQIDLAEIVWPTVKSYKDTLYNLPINQKLLIREGTKEATNVKLKSFNFLDDI